MSNARPEARPRQADGPRTRRDRSTAPSAHLVHRTARRMRYKVPSKRQDRAFFAKLEQRLAEIPAIESAVIRPETAGVLLHFAEGEGDGIAAALDALQILSLGGTQASGSSSPRTDTATRTDNAAQGLTTARIDRRALAFTVLMLLVLRQILRGGWLAPGLALLWFLFEVLRARTPQDADSLAAPKSDGAAPQTDL